MEKEEQKFSFGKTVAKSVFFTALYLGFLYSGSEVIDFVDEMNLARQKTAITKALVEKKAIPYDINNDGYEDYVFSGGDVYLYSPLKNSYLERNLNNLKKENNSKLSLLEKEVNKLGLEKDSLGVLIDSKEVERIEYLSKNSLLDSLSNIAENK
ncbi:MAG: hypothetical protein PF542_02800 [Nanoarchaeota archaeon]|jgi:hypothetical protein|nr:hypothetical protein [Nanoarchaeota archaeon]